MSLLPVRSGCPNSTNERIRFESARYIMERVLGRAGEAPATGTLDDLFAALDRMNQNAAAMQQSGGHVDDEDF